MHQFHALLSLTIIATTVFEAEDLISFSDAKIAADDQPVKAIALNPAVVGLEVAGLAIGWTTVKASGAIARGDKLISAAAGGVKLAPGGAANVFATALTAAADGQRVTILIR